MPTLSELMAAKKAATPVSAPKEQIDAIASTPAITQVEVKPKSQLAGLFAKKAVVAKETPAEPAKPVAGTFDALESKALAVQESYEEVKPKDGPAHFRETMDRLDALVGKDNQIDSLVIANARAYVKEIMMELNSFPEYDGMVLDKDVHNIMAFVQQSQNNAAAVFKEKAVAKTKKATKAATLGTVNFDILDNILESHLALPKPGINLDALGEIDTDTIESKVR